MSKILMNITMFHTKILVNAYTGLTLPAYALYQRPWQKLRAMKLPRAERVTTTKTGEIMWTRKGPPPDVKLAPSLQCESFLEALQYLDRSKKSIGYRDVLEEQIDYDENGNPVLIDGKVLKKLVLADQYEWLTTGEVLDKIDNLARGFQTMGVKKGDRVIIYAETQARWFWSCLAISKLGGVVVTLFSNLGEAGVKYGMNQTKAEVIITTEELKNGLLAFLDKLPHLKKIVYMSGPERTGTGKAMAALSKLKPPEGLVIKSLDAVEEMGKAQEVKPMELPSSSDLAVIMYTSGTTSLPKAVMLTHRQVMANVKGMMVGSLDNNFPIQDRVLASFLPLSHIYGFTFNIHVFINGGRIGFATPFTLLNSSPSHVKGQEGDLKLIKPHTMVVVPLVLERFQKEIYAKLNQRSSLAAPLFTYFMDYKTRWVKRGFDTPILNRILCSKIKNEFGGELKWIGCGGAALHAQIQSFSKSALDISLLNGYGATETTGGVYCMTAEDLDIGHVGVPFYGVKSKLVDWPEGGYMTTDTPNPRGEIIIGGDVVAMGYYEMPEETAEAFKVDEDGVRWFHTGDVGEIDMHTGRMKIIDRKKDLAKLPNGEYVSLGKIESGLRSSRYIENICICTDMYNNSLVALISPNNKVLRQLAKSLNKGHLSRREMCADQEITQIVLDSINQTGKRAKLKGKEMPVRITLTPEEWSPDNNLLTAAFKLKRKSVYEYYKDSIQRMFKEIANEDKRVSETSSSAEFKVPGKPGVTTARL